MIRFLDGDAEKVARLRGLMTARTMIRRDDQGAAVVENLLLGEKPQGNDDGA